MRTAGGLEKLAREDDVVERIIEDLRAGLATVVLGPRIARQAVVLVARMPHLCTYVSAQGRGERRDGLWTEA